MESVKEMVDDVRAKAMARQMLEDTAFTEDLKLDIPDKIGSMKKCRSGFEHSFMEISSLIGLGNNVDPARNTGKICSRAIKKFTRNYAFMLICDCAVKVGFTECEAIEFAAQSYKLSVSRGETDTEILRGWLYA